MELHHLAATTGSCSCFEVSPKPSPPLIHKAKKCGSFASSRTPGAGPVLPGEPRLVPKTGVFWPLSGVKTRDITRGIQRSECPFFHLTAAETTWRPARQLIYLTCRGKRQGLLRHLLYRWGPQFDRGALIRDSPVTVLTPVIRYANIVDNVCRK
jgi:hypothetical protein